VISYFQQLGYQFVTVDMDGFRSGNLNRLVTLDSRMLD